MKVVVVGANGQLGSDAVRAFVANGDDVKPLTHAEIEIADRDSASRAFREWKPELVVNTAAMHNVEACEQYPDRAFAINVIGAKNLALASSEAGAALVHVSTDYVYDGSRGTPYDEGDLPLPLNIYGNTKLAGEHCVRSTTERYFILRTSALYGSNPCRAKGGLNFVELMLKLARERSEVRVVDSEFVTPTSTVELAQQIVALSRSENYGLYHATAEGSCSWFGFAKLVFEATNTNVRLTVAGPDEFPAKVPRPKYSVLENRGLKRIGLNVFRPWQEGVESYIRASHLAEMATAK